MQETHDIRLFLICHVTKGFGSCYRLIVKIQTEPCGIQVSLIESLRFLLLNAVIIPIKKKILGWSLRSSIPFVVVVGEDTLSRTLEVLAVASCISKEDMVLSSFLNK